MGLWSPCTIKRTLGCFFARNGFHPVTLKKWKPYRKGKCDSIYSENQVRRQFDPNSLNAVWAGDITYIKTALGWVYCRCPMPSCDADFMTD